MNYHCTSRNNQTIFDIALSELGSIDDAVAFAFSNGFAVCDIIPQQTEFSISAYTDSDVQNAYSHTRHRPATALSLDDLILLGEMDYNYDADADTIFGNTFDKTFI